MTTKLTDFKPLQDEVVKLRKQKDELLRFVKIISLHDEHFLSQDSFNTREDCERELMHLAKKAESLIKGIAK